jgi:hypothetical protein
MLAILANFLYGDPTSLYLQLILNYAAMHHIVVPNPINTEWIVTIITKMVTH